MQQMQVVMDEVLSELLGAAAGYLDAVKLGRGRRRRIVTVQSSQSGKKEQDLGWWTGIIVCR